MTDRPRRIQRSRAKGWRMPAGAVYVGRPTIWGNPFSAVAADEAEGADPHAATVEAFALWLGCDSWVCQDRRGAILARLPELRGKDLACWCPLHKPCHADVLLELANKPEGQP